MRLTAPQSARAACSSTVSGRAVRSSAASSHSGARGSCSLQLRSHLVHSSRLSIRLAQTATPQPACAARSSTVSGRASHGSAVSSRSSRRCRGLAQLAAQQPARAATLGARCSSQHRSQLYEARSAAVRSCTARGSGSVRRPHADQAGRIVGRADQGVTAARTQLGQTAVSGTERRVGARPPVSA
jgi:hypothetical protein